MGRGSHDAPSRFGRYPIARRGRRMTATLDNAAADLHRANAQLQQRLDECRAERDAALAREAALAEVLGALNRSSGDVRPVFEAILDKAHTLCGAEYGVLLTYDGELFWTAAVHGAPPTFPERPEGIRPGFGFTGLVRGERFLHIHDMAEVAAQRPNDPVPRKLVENGIRTQLAVPLRKEGRLLGLITAYRREVRPFHGQADRAIAEFRRAGGDRDGECAALDRDTRGVGAADRDRRGAAGHQLLAGRA